ncbi:MAG: hypothetical protein RML75_05790 [Cyanobacteriota bacterium SKYGB_h_bin112]|nr:hypothetical protein [Cyanobacteriota bacterium SKYGB_h_bin112]
MMNNRGFCAFWTAIALGGLIFAGTPSQHLHAQVASPSVERRNFRPIPLRDLQRTGSLVNRDPRLLIYRLFASMDEFPQSETLQIDYQGGGSKMTAIAIFTKSGLPDDSVAGLRYYLELRRQSNGQWQVVWAGVQSRCQPNRGHQTWSSQLCV